MGGNPESTTTHDHPLKRPLETVGRIVRNTLGFVGGIVWLAIDLLNWIQKSLFRKQVRFGRVAFTSQVVRVGVKSIGIVILVSSSIGLILALQTAPSLQQFGQVDKVANLVAVAVFRELGPLIAAIVLTGFAGASIAAEIGTMVVGEEIEALESMALNPIRFLVVPRVLATTMSLILLTVFADTAAVLAGGFIGVTQLGIPFEIYQANTIEQLGTSDFLTGLAKAAVFGAILGLIACRNGLAVSGGAAGVGKATTDTVVQTVVTVIFADLFFTAFFYAIGWS
jgi:phospholipid/cholesterol/gamma-HCH transport system permease protein